MTADRDATPHTTPDNDLLQPLRPAAPPAAVDAEKIDRLLEISTDLQQLVRDYLPSDTLPAPEAHADVLAAIGKLETATEKQVTATTSQYDELMKAVAPAPDTEEGRRQNDPAEVSAEVEAMNCATARLEESAALFPKVVSSLGEVRDDLRAAVERIPRPDEVAAPPTAMPTPATPATPETAGGISEELVKGFASIDRLAARVAELESAQRTLTKDMSGDFETVHTSLDTHGKRVNSLHVSFGTVRNDLSLLSTEAREAARQSRSLRHFRVALPVILLAIVAGMLLEDQMFLMHQLFR